MKAPIVKMTVRGKVKWKVNLRKRLTGDEAYHRRYFETRKEATKFYTRFIRDVQIHGSAFAKLTDPVRAGLAKFYDLLQARQLSLEDAAQMIERHQPIKNQRASLTVADAVHAFILDCVDGGLEKSTLREYRSHLGRFEQSFGTQSLVLITRGVLHAWLNEIGVKDRTRKNYITTLRTFFALFVRHENISKNPAALIRKPKDISKDPVILSIEDIGKFAAHISRHELGLIAPIAISIFAGVRMSELFQLLWSDVDFSKRQIHIRREISKKPKQRERWIKMTDNLLMWLTLCKTEDGRVCNFGSLDAFYDRRRKAYLGATGKAWPANAARHSYASYTWTISRDANDLSREMGNSPAIAMKNYVAAVEEEKGKWFLQVVPIGGEMKLDS